LAKASKKYSKERFEYAKTNEYLPKPVGNEVSGGTVTKKPRFSKKPAVSDTSETKKKIRSTIVDDEQ
jgi:hypothetical protein